MSLLIGRAYSPTQTLTKRLDSRQNDLHGIKMFGSVFVFVGLDN